MKHCLFPFVLLIALTVPGCNRHGHAPGHQAFATPIQVSPVDQDAAEPALAPAPDGGAFIAWVEHKETQGDVMVARVGRSGELLRPPVRVNPALGVATAWRGDAPSLAAAPDGALYVSWTARKLTTDGKKTTDLMFSVSRDGGQTFSAPLRVNDDSSPADHGMHSLGAGADGRVYVAWLDDRNPQPEIEMPGMRSGPDHQMAPDQKMKHGESNRELFVAASTDGGRTFSPNLRVAGQACPCCKTSLALGPDGRIYVGWRQVLPGSFRHIAVATSTDAGKSFGSPVIVSDDNWRLAACPVSGAALDAGADGRLRVMWYAAGDAGEPGVYETESANNGTSYQPRRLFAAGSSRGMPFLTMITNRGSIGIWEGGDGDSSGIQYGLRSPAPGEKVALMRIADGTTPAAVRSEGRIFVALVVKKGEKRGIVLTHTAL